MNNALLECLYVYHACTCTVQRASDPLELALGMIVTHHVVVGTELGPL